jgi:hypothetical protein
MDLHWIAGGAVVLILVAVSAYREAIERDEAARFSAVREERRDARGSEEAVERV